MKTCCLAIVVLSAGCATTLKRASEPIAVQSTPSGADAVIQCAGSVRASCVTPTRIAIPRIATGCALTISKQGFATKVTALDRGLNGAYWSNFALLQGISLGLFLTPATNNEDRIAQAAAWGTGLSGVLGFFVDRSNGRGYRHFPDEINEKLESLR